MTTANLNPIDPNTTSGSDLAAILNAWGDGVASSYLTGTTPPSDVKRGQIFIQVISPTLWQLKVCLDVSYFLLLMSFNPQVPNVVFEGNLANGYGQTSAVPSSRFISTNGSLTGGGDFTADRSFTLVGDIGSASNFPNYYYGRNASNVIGWHPLPSAGSSSGGTTGIRQLYVLTGTAAGAAATSTFSVPAGVGGIWLHMWGGGGSGFLPDGITPTGGPGGAVSGYLPVSPGQNVPVRAGGVNDFSMLTLANSSQVIAPSGPPNGGGTSGVTFPAGLNLVAAAPLMVMAAPWGQRDNVGCVWIEWINP